MLVLWYAVLPLSKSTNECNVVSIFPTVPISILYFCTHLFYTILNMQNISFKFCWWHFNVCLVFTDNCVAISNKTLLKSINDSRHSLHGFWYQNRVIYLRHWMTLTFYLGKRWSHPGPGCERDGGCHSTYSILGSLACQERPPILSLTQTIMALKEKSENNEPPSKRSSVQDLIPLPFEACRRIYCDR